MRVTLSWPIGANQPGDTIDVDPRVADVLTREGFARAADGPVLPPDPQPPTLHEIRTFAADRGVSTAEAKRLIAAAIADRRKGRKTCV